MQKIIITAADGYLLSALYASPVSESIGNIILSSATGVRKEFYINFARFLVQNGYSVLLYDYRGIGESAPDNLKASASYMHEWGTLDMNAVLEYMVYEKELTGIIWLGHSVGAQMVGFIDHRQHIRKVIAISAAFGYWKYFPSPIKWKIWALWYFVGPLMVGLYGYGTMKKIGWGENLSRNMMTEWREWCLSKTYFTAMLKRKLNKDKFYGFTIPITSVYMSDDDLANDITAPMMMKFFPDSQQQIYKLPVNEYTTCRVGHIGIFRKKFQNDLWPVLIDIIGSARHKMGLKIISILIIFFITPNCFSQDRKIIDISDVTKINFLSPGLSFEKRIGKFQSIYAEGLGNLTAFLAFSSPGGPATRSGLYISPAFTLQYRYYYNFEKRKVKKKRTAMNSLNYASLAWQTIFSNGSISPDYLTENKRRAINTVGIVWGMQRNYRSRFSLDLQLGGGYLFAKATTTVTGRAVNKNVGKLTSIADIKLGFLLNKRK